MFKTVLWAILLCGSAFASKNRSWQDCELMGISSNVSDNGIAVMPIGTAIAGIPIRRVNIWFRVDTATMKYMLYVKQRRKPLNVTVHGKTKIAIDGITAYLLDDAGKEIKLPIVEKAIK